MPRVLKASHKKVWVAALRSGKYEQGVKTWFDGEAFCATGVGVDAIEDGWWVKRKSEKYSYWEFSGGDHITENWFLKSATEEQKTHLFNYVQGRNDLRLATFNQLADWIERNA